MEQTQRVKVAVQKSGRLTENSLELLSRCGLRYSRSRERLFCFGENMPVDVMLVRDDDIPHLVGDGICDLGIVGMNVLEESAHGGQVKPPFLPPPILPVNNEIYTAGEFDLGNGRYLYINRGLGSLWPIRFNARPEITVFSLTRQRLEA